VAHTPELQAYTASKLYLALKSDISQESLTLAATWILGEYSDILLEGGIVDDQSSTPVGLFSKSKLLHSLTLHIASRLGIN
jgi:AP-1 complex subunit gamma-1